MFRYFIQPQLNKNTNSIVGYELLIRKFVDNRWQLPENFSTIPVQTQIELLKATVAQLSLKVNSVSLNLNRKQFLNKALTSAIINTQKQLLPVTLIVEITEDVSAQHYPVADILKQAEYFADFGIQLSLDDVGTGRNLLTNIQPLLPSASELKFAMQNFRQLKRTKEIPEQIQYWQGIAKKHRLRFVLEGIENQDEDTLADQLDVSLRQGYFYGQPHLLKVDLPTSRSNGTESAE